ncbi:hypothetical protein ACGFJT_34735 [Actinomadura geliboluensis]|uniref:TRADD-N-associated membrane domain-containing protein n=1 Tax=Actinomadura geliboluensis TaxID=882440 RepID=UPI00371015D3
MTDVEPNPGKAPGPNPSKVDDGELGVSRRVRVERARALAAVVVLIASTVMVFATGGVVEGKPCPYSPDDTCYSVDAASTLQASMLAIALIATGLWTVYARLQRAVDKDARLLREKADLSDEETDRLSAGNLELGVLWSRTEERLRVYHTIATRQANISFISAQAAICIGFIVVLAAAIMAMNADKDSTRIVLGVLGTAGAALSAYIGRTFIRSQENAATHLRTYFGQPQETFRFLVAERLIERLPEEQRAQSIEYFVQAVLLSGLSIEQVTAALTPPQSGPQDTPQQAPAPPSSA